MPNSHKFFSNPECKYYPCHKMAGDLNCLFCYCPLYFLPDCGGNAVYTPDGVKNCSDCLRIHGKDGWDFVQKRLNKEFHIRTEDKT